MPNMVGFDVCKILQKNPKTQQIKILAMTGYPSPENVQRIISLGAIKCFAKPIDRKELIFEIDQCVSLLNMSN
jgi:CheY-like chemotaxis protein